MFRRFILGSLFLVMGLFFGCYAVSAATSNNETLTIVTYYPSPFGAYNQLRANKMVIGESNSTTIPSPSTNGIVIFKGLNSDPYGANDTQAGALYYNNSDSEFKYYDGSGWQALGGGSGCYVSYSGGCMAGFINKGSAGSWGYCCIYCGGANAHAHFRPPGGGCGTGGWLSSTIGSAYVCCR